MIFSQSHIVKNKLHSLILDIFWKNVENKQTNKETLHERKVFWLPDRSDSAKNITFTYASVFTSKFWCTSSLNTLIIVPCCTQVYDSLIFENFIYLFKSIGFRETLCCWLIVKSLASFFLLQEIAEKMTLAF